ncbi:MAG: SPOR domain-containing protein [Candidatus Marinimicrobia bacterium]|nr:SPOR domain-containing protein [Candidatus Neomarinimicrobiota bacterium]MBL7010754.1 SPOR domain-containing protein [Candidatus Neomarinimicrobiota bacterium]MBL7031159.1 SPOR domain-containing protein [Candidatus Neomarinimicrobiota bacterium]
MKKRGFIMIVILWGWHLPAQNIDLYITLLEKGKMDEVRETLPELLDRYPDEAGVYYLQAMLNENGDSSLVLFRKLIENFPESDFASKSEMKVGEYLFSRGLYSQAGVQFKTILSKYPQGDHRQRAMDLMVNAYFATGEEKLAKATLRTFKQLYPSLNYKKYGIDGLDNSSRDAKLVRLDPDATSNRIKSFKASRNVIIPKYIPKPWVIQVGAFGKYENANRLKKQLQGNGYATEVHSVNSNGKRLHAVRIVRFETKKSAEKIGRKLKKKFGLDFRVLNNPE